MEIPSFVLAHDVADAAIAAEVRRRVQTLSSLEIACLH